MGGYIKVDIPKSVALVMADLLIPEDAVKENQEFERMLAVNLFSHFG